MQQYFEQIMDYINEYASQIMLAFGAVNILFLLLLCFRLLGRAKLYRTLRVCVEKIDNVNELNQSIVKLTKLCGDTSDICASILAKIQAIIEVQNIAYSVNDGYSDEVHQQIMSLLTTARLETTKTRAELLSKIEELESAMTRQKAEHDKTIAEAKSIIDGKTTKGGLYG